MVVGRPPLSVPLLGQLLSRRIPTVFVSVHGRYRGRLQPPLAAALGPRLAQLAALKSPERTFPLVRGLVSAKLAGQRSFLSQQARGQPDLDLSAELRSLDDAARAVPSAPDRARLLGVEGRAGRAYWSGFVRSIRVEHSMRRRGVRPPPDPINAALSFGYALLLAECVGAAETVDLDPAVGVYHTLRHRRPALGLDLMEPFRPSVVDRLVVRSFNRRQLRPEHFEARDGGCFLTADGRRTYVELFDTVLESDDGLPTPETPQKGEPAARSWRDAIRRSAFQFRRALMDLRLCPLDVFAGSRDGDAPREGPSRGPGPARGAA